MLFPKLSPEEAWARIDAAVRGQSDPERWAAIERIVAEEGLDGELLGERPAPRSREGS
jgi:hypothetical protein